MNAQTETEKLLDIIHKDFEEHELKTEEELQAEFKEYRKTANTWINKIIRKLKKYPYRYTYELNFIKTKIKPYLNKYSWLPDSYLSMLKNFERMRKN